MNKILNEGLTPGMPFFEALRKVGCNINWLLDDSDQSGAESVMMVREESTPYGDKCSDLEAENERLRVVLTKLQDALREVDEQIKIRGR